MENHHAKNRKRKPPARHYNPYISLANESGNNDKKGGTGNEPELPAHDCQRSPLISQLSSETIEGRNAVLEAVRAGVAIDKVFIAKGETDSALRHIASTVREAGAAVVEADRRKLDSMSATNAHQGVIAVAACADFSTIGDILEKARLKGEKPLVIICDEISDPHNLGAIIRTCEAAGGHGVIIPKRRSAGLGATVAKASSGAVYHTPVARVANITAAIAELKKAGLWIYGASAGGSTPLWEADFSDAAALVIGSEGTGISRLVSENCDFHVSIPMFGKISSLNASVSAAVLIYEAVRQRALRGAS